MSRTPFRCRLGAPAALAALAASCAPATLPTSGTTPLEDVTETCNIEPERYGIFEVGDVPLVVTSTHAGVTTPLGCGPDEDQLRAIGERTCEGVDDDACRSGPCRAGSGDRGARLISFALIEELERCLGGRPHFALSEVSRTLVDMNRDARDPGGLGCAMGDAAALPYWEAWHRGVEGLVGAASAQAEKAGAKALLLDVHTYNSLPAAPPPSVMMGAGVPFGTTMPVLAAEDPSFERVFGERGLRVRLVEELGPLVQEAGAKRPLAVLPAALDASLEGLFAGRYMVHRYARVVPGETQGAGPVVDALQIEMSARVRDDELGAARGLARAICGAFADRLGAKRPPGQHAGAQGGGRG